MAYITADRAALLSIFSDPDNFYAAAPFTFLMASLIVLIFGPGRFSLDLPDRAQVEAALGVTLSVQRSILQLHRVCRGTSLPNWPPSAGLFSEC